MGKHLEHDLDDLKKEILAIGSLVEEATSKAIKALISRDPALATEVIEHDDVIDTKEVRVETECMKILALHQPVAADLRFVVTVLKVNNDLERIGDLAVNIAKRAHFLAGEEYIGSAGDLTKMCKAVGFMVRQSLDALVQLNTKLALDVCARDQEVDDEHRRMITKLQTIMSDDPATISRGISTLWISRCLERIADLATNIAEDVVFLVDGDVIRHGMGGSTPH